MSKNDSAESAAPNIALGLLQDPNFAKALEDLASPMMKTQETVLNKIIDNQNTVSSLFLQLVEKMETIEVTINKILEEVKK